MTDFIGTSGPDSIMGTASDDTFDLSQGGEDSAQGGAGNDVFNMGATLDAGDRIDGGQGGEGPGDRIVLDGDYSAGLVLVDATFTSIRNLDTLADHHYDLTFADGNIADSGGDEAQLLVNAYGSTRLDDRAETAGSIFFQPSVNNCTFLGGAGDDAWSATVAMHARDSFDGGGGFDTVLLSQSQRFTSGNLFNVEDIRVVFGGDRTIRTVDANVAAGATLRIDGSQMSSGSLTLKGSAERDGRLEILGSGAGDRLTAGHGADTIQGGDGNDTLVGGAGGDQLSGGSGADLFVYRSAAESGQAADLISDLDASDSIDLHAIDANTGKAGNQAFHIVDHFTGAAGQLVLSYSAGKDITTLAGDVDGDGKADISIHLSGDQTGFTGIVL